MGNNSSTPLDEATIEDITNTTHCLYIYLFLIHFMINFFMAVDSSELKDLYKQFKKEVPQGYISKKDFDDALKNMGFSDQNMRNYLFKIFDRDNSGEISFKNFIQAVSVLARGSEEEKIECVYNLMCIDIYLTSMKDSFSMYDIDGDGYLTKNDLKTVLESFYGLVGPLVTLSGKKYDNIDTFIKDFFENMGHKIDGKISLEDYKEGVMKNTNILQGIKMFSDN